MNLVYLTLLVALALAGLRPGCTATARDFLAGLPGAYVGAVPPLALINGNLDNYDVNYGVEVKPAAYVIYLKFPLSLNTARELAGTDSIMAQIGLRNAIAIITLEPWNGLGAIAQADLDYLGSKLADWERNKKVTQIMRFAHEMNGAWYPWAQRPLQYSTCRGATLWAPNEASGYPFNGGTYSVMGGTSGVVCSAADYTNPATECYALDTNHDGVVNLSDDPFTPYYPTNPGDDIVDMVGLSVYHFGDPTGTQSVPNADKLLYAVTAGPPTWPFYQTFAVNRDKSFILPETAAMWDTQYATSCPNSSPTGRKLLTGRQLTAAIALPTAAAALGTIIASSDFETTPDAVFSGRYNTSSTARASFDFSYRRNGYVYSGNYAVRTIVNAAGPQPWDIQLTSVNLNLEAGKTYQARLWVRSDSSTNLQLAWTNAVSWQPEVTTTEPVTSSYRNIYLPGLTPAVAGPYQLQINMGRAPAGTNFFVDGIEIYETLVKAASSEFEVLPQSVFEQRLGGSAMANFNWNYPGSAAVGVASARVDIMRLNTAPINFWDIQVSTKNVQLAAGRSYSARGFIQADRVTAVTLAWTRVSDWTAVVLQTQSVTTTWQEFIVPVFAVPATAAYQLQIGMGTVAVGAAIYLDSIQVFDGPAPARTVGTGPPPPPTPAPGPSPSPSPPPSIETMVLEVSSDFESLPNLVYTGKTAGAAVANMNLSSSESANTGNRSARVAVITPTTSAPWNIQLTTGNVVLQAGRTYKAYLWVMASRADTIQVAWTNTATWTAAVLVNQPVSTYWSKLTLPPYTPAGAGTYQFQINMAGAQAGTVFFIDDVAVLNGPCYIPSELEVKQAWWRQVFVLPTAANPMSKLKMACWFDIKKAEAAVQNHVVDWTVTLNSTIRDAFMRYITDPTTASRWRMLSGYLVDRASQPLCPI